MNIGNKYGSYFGSDVESMFPQADVLKAANNANQIEEFGWNMPSAKLGVSAFTSLASLWGAFKGLNQAKKEFEFNKRITEKNLANSTKSYNTALEDKARARASASGNMSKDDVQKYVTLNQLSN